MKGVDSMEMQKAFRLALDIANIPSKSESKSMLESAMAAAAENMDQEEVSTIFD